MKKKRQEPRVPTIPPPEERRCPFCGLPDGPFTHYSIRNDSKVYLVCKWCAKTVGVIAPFRRLPKPIEGSPNPISKDT